MERGGQRAAPERGRHLGPDRSAGRSARRRSAWTTTNWTGRGIGVAIIDSGLEMSSEFTGRVTAFYDFTTGGIVATTPYDDYGHGTHVAGTIGGSGVLSSNE